MSLATVGTTNKSFLLNLPLEVLQNVLNQVDNKADLYSLLEACPRFYHFIVPVIWKSVSLKVRNNRKLGETSTGIVHLLGARSQPINRLEYVKELVIKGTGRPQKWCFHQDNRSKAYFRDLGAEILLFLSHLKENSLKHFVWESGTCVPEELLGYDGYLPAKQRNLETLKLVLNPRCFEDDYTVNELCLSEFNKLKYFSLEGTRSSENEEAVSDLLLASCDTLVEVELNLVPKEPNSFWLGSSWHVRKTFSLSEAKTIYYPNMRRLSLSFVSFEGSEADFALAMDIPSLTTVTLRYCRGTGELFREVLCTCDLMNLRWLEVQYDKVGYGDVESIVELLKRCPNLENLAVGHGQEMSHYTTFKIWEAACFNKVNFRGFVFHMVDVRMSQDFPSPRSHDSMDLLVTTSSYIAVPDRNPFTHANLDFLGICCHPDEILQGILLPFTQKNCLRVLHIRKSASDIAGTSYFKHLLNKFTQWAFSPEGITSLECLLFGDFSTRKSRKNVNSRSDRIATPPFYQTTLDPEIADLSQRHRSLAMACPSQFGVF